MPELRQDPTTKEWIIIATERAKRPHDFRSTAKRAAQPAYDEACPFCPGHELETPPEVLARRERGAANEPGWQLRVIPNKFAALLPEGSTTRRVRHDFFREMDGVGYHEVIVESPTHNRFIPAMERDEVEAILHAYRDRCVALREDRRVKLIMIFRNHGEAAGTSLLHPHSQLVATPVIPGYVRRKYEEATRYCDATGHCLYCDLLEAERQDAERVLLESESFVVFHPFASHTPFETWIVPKQHRPVYGQVSMEEVRDLAGVLKEVLWWLAELLNDPDYNYVFHCAPVDGENEEYYHWHLQIVPRLTRIAGFEIGSGMRINTARPEQTAQFWRESQQKVGTAPQG
jgi:UDPglucose--hexose-1-phosphate uridylyltransferase